MKIFSNITACLLLFAVLIGCNDFNQIKNSTSGNKAREIEKWGENLPEDVRKPNDGPYTDRKMLANLGLNIFFKHSEKFSADVNILKFSIENYCQSLNKKDSDEIQLIWKNLDASYRNVVISLHTIEAAPVGPYIANGRFLADYTYSWPVVDRCAIDRSVRQYSLDTSYSPDSAFYSQRGLAAIEYLLYEGTLKSNCNSHAYPDLQIWNQQLDQHKKQQRCAWALKMMDDVDQKAQTLKKSWDAQDGNYTAQFYNTQIYETTKEAVNAITHGLSNIEKLKDLRIGKPLGRHKDCEADRCSEDSEHYFSGYSFLAIESQLQTFKAIFTGSRDISENAFGFDDMLEQAGNKEVSQKMLIALDRALLTAKELKNQEIKLSTLIENMNMEDCKKTTISSRLVPICALHSDVREVAYLFKTEVLTALSLKSPPTHQGDND